MQTHTYMHIHTHTCTYMQTHTYMHIHAHMKLCSNIYTCTHMQTHIYAHAGTHICTHAAASTHVSLCVCCLLLVIVWNSCHALVTSSNGQIFDSRGSAPPRRWRFKTSHVKHCFFRTLQPILGCTVGPTQLVLLLVMAALVEELEELVEALVLLSMPSAGPATEAIAAAIAAAAAPSVAGTSVPGHVLEA